MKKLLIASAIAALTLIPIAGSVLAQEPSFSSPYMNAGKTPIVEIAKGAKVAEDTAAYWNLRFYIIPAVPSAFIPILN